MSARGDKLKQWVSQAIERFDREDLAGLSEPWRVVFTALPDYLENEQMPDERFLWMIDGTTDRLPDVVFNLQRIKRGLVEKMLLEQNAELLKTTLGWFDRVTMVLIENFTGRISKRHSMLKPYETIFWNARDGMYISSLEGRFLQCNEALIKMFCKGSLDDILDMDIINDLYLDKTEREIMVEHLKRDGFYDHHEFTFKSGQGVKTALESCYLVKSAVGQEYIVGVLVDITKEKAHEKKIRNYMGEIERQKMQARLAVERMRRNYNTLMEVSEHSTFTADAETLKIKSFNTAFAKRFRHRKKQSLFLKDLFPLADWMSLFPKISEIADDSRFEVKGVTCRQAGDETFKADLTVSVCPEEKREVLYFQITDRGERFRLSGLLETLKDDLQAFMQKAPFGVIGFNCEGEPAFCNHYLVKRLGYSSHKLLSLNRLNSLFTEEEQQLKFKKYIQDILAGRHMDGAPTSLRAKSGMVLHFEITTLPWHLDGQEKAGFLTCFADVTKEKRVEELLESGSDQPGGIQEKKRALEARLREMQAAYQNLTEKKAFLRSFFDQVVEEIKNPIEVIYGFVGLLLCELNEAMTESQSQDMEIIQTNAAHLLNILEKATVYFQLDAGEVENQPRTMVVRNFLDKLFNKLDPMSLPPKVTFSSSHQILSPEYKIEIDPLLVEGMLRPLLENALQFTEEGRISLTGYEEQGVLWIEVSDSGAGMSGAEARGAFEPFFRVPKNRNKPHRGLGLGMAIAAHYANLLGSEIQIQSQTNQGCVLKIRLAEIRLEEEPVPILRAKSSV